MSMLEDQFFLLFDSNHKNVIEHVTSNIESKNRHSYHYQLPRLTTLQADEFLMSKYSYHKMFSYQQGNFVLFHLNR